MPFDPDSGLVYAEKIIRPNRWRRAEEAQAVYNRLRRRPSIGVSANGTNTLKETAKRCLLRNLDLVDSQLLSLIPNAMVEYLWLAIRRNNLDGLAMWKAFAPLGCLGMSSVKSYAIHQDIDFQRGIDQVNSPASIWMTNLSLTNLFLSGSDLMYVSKLANLKILQIASGRWGSMEFKDSTLRGWAESAKSEGFFSNLQAIFVHGHEDVTKWSLQHLSNFPSLDTFAVHFCNFDKSSRKFSKMHGWSASNDGTFMQFALSKSNRTGQPNYVLYKDWASLVQAYSSSQRHLEPDEAKKPLLNATWADGRADSRVSSYPVDLDKLYCFERDWNFKATDQPSQPEDHERAKKRKLKDGMALSLDNILDSL